MNLEHDRIGARQQGRIDTRSAFITSRIKKLAAIGNFYHNTEPKDKSGAHKKAQAELIEAKAEEMLNATYDHAFGRGVQDTGQALRIWNNLYSYVEHALKNPHQSPSYLWGSRR